VTGPVSADVVRVEVVTHSLPTIAATVENAWFSAWWPTQPGRTGPDRSLMPPYRIRAFNADGFLLAEQEE
jgi:hypothetical protein